MQQFNGRMQNLKCNQPVQMRKQISKMQVENIYNRYCSLKAKDHFFAFNQRPLTAKSTLPGRRQEWNK